MLFQPLGSQQKTALSNNAVTCCQAFEHRKESIALCPESHGPQDEFRRLVGGYENELLIANSLYGVFGNYRHCPFSNTERAEGNIHVHSDLEHLSRIEEFNANLRSSRRRIDFRVDVRNATAKDAIRIGVRGNVCAGSDAHRGYVFCVSLTNAPNG